MAFFPYRRSVPRSPSRSTPVIAVGQRVFVDSAGNRSGSVVLADENGKVLSAVSLADGVEVEVVAWRPRGASDTRYRVRTSSGGADGWVPADNLRRALVSVPAPEPTTPGQATAVTDADGRRFGQRSHTQRLPPSGSPAPAQPVSVADTGGRRFGQHNETGRLSASGASTPAEPVAVAEANGRPFGQRFETEGLPVSPSPTPAQPASVEDTGGRRFGQHNETEPLPTPGAPKRARPAHVAGASGRKFGQH